MTLQQELPRLQPNPPGGRAGGAPWIGHQKFLGWVKSYNPKQGYGFLECPEARSKYGRDVFIHKAQMGELLGRFVGPGTKLDPTTLKIKVRFTVAMNKQGFPQARDVARLDDFLGAGPGAGGCCQELQARPCPTAFAPNAGGLSGSVQQPVLGGMAALHDDQPMMDGGLVHGFENDGADNEAALRGYKGRGGTIRIVHGTDTEEDPGTCAPSTFEARDGDCWLEATTLPQSAGPPMPRTVARCGVHDGGGMDSAGYGARGGRRGKGDPGHFRPGGPNGAGACPACGAGGSGNGVPCGSSGPGCGSCGPGRGSGCTGADNSDSSFGPCPRGGCCRGEEMPFSQLDSFPRDRLEDNLPSAHWAGGVGGMGSGPGHQPPSDGVRGRLVQGGGGGPDFGSPAPQQPSFQKPTPITLQQAMQQGAQVAMPANGCSQSMPYAVQPFSPMPMFGMQPDPQHGCRQLWHFEAGGASSQQTTPMADGFEASPAGAVALPAGNANGASFSAPYQLPGPMPPPSPAGNVPQYPPPSFLAPQQCLGSSASVSQPVYADAAGQYGAQSQPQQPMGQQQQQQQPAARFLFQQQQALFGAQQGLQASSVAYGMAPPTFQPSSGADDGGDLDDAAVGPAIPDAVTPGSVSDDDEGYSSRFRLLPEMRNLALQPYSGWLSLPPDHGGPVGPAGVHGVPGSVGPGGVGAACGVGVPGMVAAIGACPTDAYAANAGVPRGPSDDPWASDID